MNLSEFKAWFEGYTEAMEGRPTEKQWKRIQGRVGEIKDAPTSYQQFVQYIPTYLPPAYPWYWNRPYWAVGGVGLAAGGGNMQMSQMLGMQSSGGSGHASGGGATAYAMNSGGGPMLSGKVNNAPPQIEWNSGDAFRDLGRADALNG